MNPNMKENIQSINIELKPTQKNWPLVILLQLEITVVVVCTLIQIPVAEVGPLTFMFQISKYKLPFLSYFLSAFGMGRQYHYFAFVEFLDLCKQSQEDVYFRIWKEQGNGHFSSENTHKQTKLRIYMLEGGNSGTSRFQNNLFCRTQEKLVNQFYF